MARAPEDSDGIAEGAGLNVGKHEVSHFGISGSIFAAQTVLQDFSPQETTRSPNTGQLHVQLL